MKIGLAATNGQFPSDYDIARAIVQMWKKVGIDADLQVIEYAKYFELNRGGKLPEATLYSWDNATGDPEIFTGYQLNPKMPFSPWKDEDIGQKVLALFGVADYDKRIAGYRDLERYAVEYGATMPLVAERADARAQEKSDLHKIWQWLGAAADPAMDLTDACSPRPPTARSVTAASQTMIAQLCRSS